MLPPCSGCEPRDDKVAPCVLYMCDSPQHEKNLIFDALVVTLDNKPPTLLGVHCEQLQSFEKGKRRKGESPETAGLKAGAVTPWNTSATMPV